MDDDEVMQVYRSPDGKRLRIVHDEGDSIFEYDGQHPDMPEVDEVPNDWQELTP